MHANSEKINRNLAKFTELLRVMPYATHVLLKRPDGVRVDIPLLQAERMIRNKPDWTVDEVAAPGPKLPTTVLPPVVVPPKPSEVAAAPEQAVAPVDAVVTPPAPSSIAPPKRAAAKKK
jgi:hypothetical protein